MVVVVCLGIVVTRCAGIAAVGVPILCRADANDAVGRGLADINLKLMIFVFL